MKDSFSIGEEVSFDYTFSSDIAQQIEYIVSVNCPNVPVPLFDIKVVELKKGISLSQNYVYITSISEDFESQTCKAIVSILSPEESFEEKEFNIVTSSGFDFNLFLCKEESCLEKSKVFVKGENIYLNYESNISDLNIITNLIYPDGTEKQITFPFSITADKVGNYELKVSASKEGYKTITKNLQFGVIEKDAKINEVTLFGGENLFQNEIFYGKRISGDGKINFWHYLIYFFIILFIILFTIFLRFVIFPMVKKKKR